MALKLRRKSARLKSGRVQVRRLLGPPRDGVDLTRLVHRPVESYAPCRKATEEPPISGTPLVGMCTKRAKRLVNSGLWAAT